MRQESTHIKILDEADCFTDNLDHLTALEYEARVRLAMAYLKGKAWKEHRQAEDIAGELREAHETGADAGCHGVNTGFLNLRNEKLTVKEVESLLEKAETRNRLMAENSLRRGIELNFEKLCGAYGLDEFERTAVMLVFANNSSTAFRGLYQQTGLDRQSGGGGMSIEAILSIISGDLRGQIRNRKYFSIESRLIRSEIFLMNGPIGNTTNILEAVVSLHERIVRYITGDDNVYNGALKCVSREDSKVSLDHVMLPDGVKEEIVKIVERYAARNLNESRKLAESRGLGNGLTLFFYGPSGTGKTMMAKALANRLNKPLISLNIGELSNGFGTTMLNAIRHAFREALLCDGIVFFDECDDIFMGNSRESMSLLIEIEKAECITILATNSVYDLDPAMDRRFSMKVRFEIPDEPLRERIWRELLPENVRLGGDVDVKRLAKKYIFTGGLIRNTIMMAANYADAYGDGPDVVITSRDIEKAAFHQGFNVFGNDEFNERYMPGIAVSELPLDNRNKLRIQGLVTAYREGHNDIHLVVGSKSLQTGIDAADAFAKGCGLEVKKFSLSVFLNTTLYNFIDPVTRKQKNSLIDYVLDVTTGHEALILLVDYDSTMGADNTSSCKMRDFLNKLRTYRGPVFVVTEPLKKERLPKEFDFYIETGYPPRELQVERWESLFKGSYTKDQVIALVDSYDLHLSDIDFVFRQAKLLSYVKARNEDVDMDALHEVLKGFKSSKSTPLLFGSKA